MATRYKFFETVWNDDIQHTQQGIMQEGIKDLLLSNEYILYKIPLGEQYRPDLIAYKFYGSADYYWILVYANDISDCPQGFEVERQIKIPNPAIIGTIV